jgi:hypothetical protein
VRRTSIAVALLVAACSACSSSSSSSSSGPPSGPPGAVTELPSPPAIEEPLPCVPGAEPFTGPAAQEYGADRVMAAYCLLAGLVEEQRTTSLALPIPEQRTRDLSRLASVLTPAVRREWDRLVRARAGGDPVATARVNGLTLHDVAEVPRGYRRADDLPHVFGTRVGPAVAGLTRDGALRLSFATGTNLVLEKRGDDSGRHSLLPVTREASYVLVPDGEGWLVDDWRAEFERGPVQVVTQ